MERCNSRIASTGRAEFRCPKCGNIAVVRMGSLSGRVYSIEGAVHSSDYVDVEEKEFLEKLERVIRQKAKKDPKWLRLLE